MNGPRERILVVGPYGAGKSTTWVQVAKWLKRSESPARMFITDTDAAAARMAPPDNVEIFDAFDWPDYDFALSKSKEAVHAGEGDWLVVDMIDKAWEAAQNYFVEEVFGTAAERFFLEARKEGKEGSPLSGAYGVNWNVINKLYSSWFSQVIRWPGNVLACTPGDPVNRQSDNPDTINLYGATGVKPRGQKHLGHGFHSVLLVGEDSSGHYFTTIKDREREMVTHQPLRDFVLDYLKPIGGWTL